MWSAAAAAAARRPRQSCDIRCKCCWRRTLARAGPDWLRPCSRHVLCLIVPPARCHAWPRIVAAHSPQQPPSSRPPPPPPHQQRQLCFSPMQVFSEVHFGNHFALEGQSRKKSDICRWAQPSTTPAPGCTASRRAGAGLEGPNTRQPRRRLCPARAWEPTGLTPTQCPLPHALPSVQGHWRRGSD